MRPKDTIVALSSGRPPAAISILRISGTGAHRAAAEIMSTLPHARVASVREIRDPHTGDLLDQALVLRFDGPASSTGEDLVELHCHGGRAVVDALLSALVEIDGVREAQPGEFTRRAFDNGRIDLTEAEGLADLIEAETQSQRKAALALAEGGLRRSIEEWRERLVGLSAIAERAIDYDEEDAAFDSSLSRESELLANELDEWLERPRIEPLKDGVRVVVAGPPNAGKSSLINAITGVDKVIVTDIPGTTRDSVEVPLALGGVPVQLTDTAGLRETEDDIEAIGIARAAKLVEASDVLIWLGELDDAPSHPRLVAVHAKADLPCRQAAPEGALAVSSLNRQGVGELLKRIEALARTVLPSEGQIVLNRRQSALLADARGELHSAALARDVVIYAEHIRHARTAFDRLTGRAGVEDVLDSLFGRFCLGK
ncbi:MAG TPA: tRNA uridine-5-carboxymethylaminomethyl(34) synthesis GTPase MnmE [Sphingomicrobium sp.]|nr:tRNA uridine-5-carboxymethylaminomethyl(34) synthesis GTPase MnmE [Sphingomicrobium sp.]